MPYTCCTATGGSQPSGALSLHKTCSITSKHTYLVGFDTWFEALWQIVTPLLVHPSGRQMWLVGTTYPSRGSKGTGNMGKSQKQPACNTGNNGEHGGTFATPPGTPEDQCTFDQDQTFRCAGGNAWFNKQLPWGFAEEEEGGAEQEVGHGSHRAVAHAASPPG